MSAIWLLLALVASDPPAPRVAPYYTAGSTVNAADNVPGYFSPNSIATIYGTNLAFATVALSPSDLNGAAIPSVLPNTGVRVQIAGLPAGIYYVSPTQVNFLFPSLLTPGPATLHVVIDGLDGPAVTLQIFDAAPAFFQLDAKTVIATEPDGSVISSEHPAKPGDYVVLYATGLGAVVPPLGYLEIPEVASWILDLSSLKITLDAAAVEASDILYAGVAPGFAGLYQINLHLPASVGANPAIRIAMGQQISPDGLILPVQTN